MNAFPLIIGFENTRAYDLRRKYCHVFRSRSSERMLPHDVRGYVDWLCRAAGHVTVPRAAKGRAVCFFVLGCASPSGTHGACIGLTVMEVAQAMKAGYYCLQQEVKDLSVS